VLFEVLSGRLPLEGDTLAEIAARHRQTAAPNLLKLVPQLPTEIAWLVRRTMAKDPLRRPQTARELIQQLIGLEIATFSERALA
jgi:serine/threonine-protein kinase